MEMAEVMPLSATSASSGTMVTGRGNLDVNQSEYLGSISSQGLSMQAEVSQRLAKAGHALRLDFHRLKRLSADDMQMSSTIEWSVLYTKLLFMPQYIMDVEPGQFRKNRCKFHEKPGHLPNVVFETDMSSVPVAQAGK